MTRTRRWPLACAVPLAALLAALPAHALYKVVTQDGKVTYTDTPPPASSGAKVIQLGSHANVIGDAVLPLELRQAAQRFPVTLYTMKGCDPCDSARALLRQRGVPFSEKLVVSGEDGDALARVSGGRDAPTVTIGAQVLRGFAAETWKRWLDTAGYPRESRLPPGYQYPAATPLTEPAAASAPVPRSAPAAPTPPGEAQLPASSTGIRF